MDAGNPRRCSLSTCGRRSSFGNITSSRTTTSTFGCSCRLNYQMKYRLYGRCLTAGQKFQFTLAFIHGLPLPTSYAEVS